MSISKNIKHMIRDIEREVEYTRHMIGKDALDPKVMKAMAEVPRQEFVSDELKAFAFDNGPMPIGHGQTISQPYIVALMTDLLQLAPTDIVLEIGTGSGYQTAILSQLCARVYSIEVIEALATLAAERFQQLHYSNIESRVGSGYSGWPEHAPYDAIIVTAAATHIPPALIEQLRPGGKLVIPVGQPYMSQHLLLVEKDKEGHIETSDILAVAFVPLQEDNIETDSDRTLH
jgi:protein-L-isoaspartate(D-aspartate) O-methyltransferase